MTSVLMVKVSPEFKAAIEEAANIDADADGNLSEFIRECVATSIGYDLSSDTAMDGRGRPRTYETDEQRMQARREAERARQLHRKQVVEAIMKQNRLESIDALEAWLAQRGISVTDDVELAQSA